MKHSPVLSHRKKRVIISPLQTVDLKIAKISSNEEDT
jgi:hypothetical protein